MPGTHKKPYKPIDDKKRGLTHRNPNPQFSASTEGKGPGKHKAKQHSMTRESVDKMFKYDREFSAKETKRTGKKFPSTESSAQMSNATLAGINEYQAQRNKDEKYSY